MGSSVRSAGRITVRRRDRGYNWTRRPGDRGPSWLEESPDTEGQDAGATQAAKADGKWHRKETAGEGSRETSTVRVKRWGKSPPASWRHGGSPNPVRCKANRFRYEAARPGTGLPPRGMGTGDRIRLTGLLRKKPWKRGFFYLGKYRRFAPGRD